MKTITASQVKKLEAGSSVWIRKNGTDRRSEYKVIQYGKEKRIRHGKAGNASAPRPIKDYPGFVYEVEI